MRLTSFLLFLLSALQGCGNAPVEQIAPNSIPESPTYSQHIAPLMHYYCVTCHSPESQLGNSDDYNFSNYNDVVANYEALVEVVFKEDSMPPGAAERLNALERAILTRWANHGFPQ